MHKLIEYICDELEELERKAEKDGKLSMAEVQYMDTLAHAKKNLLKADKMSDDYSGYYRSYDGNRSYDRNRSYDDRSRSYDGRSSRRDSMGRYSREGDMMSELRALMEEAPDERTRKEFERFISKMEQM